MEGARYLEDGKLTVFRRNGIYYARIRISPAKYIWRSLKTSNEQTAVDLGRRLLFQIEQRADQGLPPKSKLFAAVIDDYIRHRERDHRHGGTSSGMLRQIVRVSKFWQEYAGELAVEAIDDKEMREFIPWRRGMAVLLVLCMARPPPLVKRIGHLRRVSGCLLLRVERTCRQRIDDF